MSIPSAVDAALRTVFDPCAVNAGAPINVVDMGLVTEVAAASGGEVRVTVRTTTPMCTLVGSIMVGIEHAVGAVPGVTRVTVRVDPRADWTEAAITGAGLEALRERRARSRREVAVRPREWQLRTTPGEG